MTKPKVLLVQPPYLQKKFLHFPLGLGYLAGACVSRGIDVDVVDLNLPRSHGDNDICSIIRAHGYGVIGIGGFLMQVKNTIALSKTIKREFPQITIVVGGIQTFGTEEFLLRESHADILVLGEAEETFPSLVERLFQGKDYSDMPAIAYRKDGGIKINSGFGMTPDLDQISFPAYHLFDMEGYLSMNYHNQSGRRTIDFLASRGCPYICNYCINSTKPVKMRYRNPDLIVKEIRLLKEKFGVNDFSFADEIFEINKKKSIEICEAIKDEKITWITSCRADGIDSEIISTMQDAGCRMILVGFESGSEKILKSMNKKTNLDKYHNAVKVLRKHGMEFYANFMIGDPEETEETIRETEKFCIENELIFGPSYLTPFPGTALYEQIKGKIADESEYFLSIGETDFSRTPAINLTSMPLAKLIYLRNQVVISTTSSTIKKKMPFIPLFIIKLIAGVYIRIMNSNSSIASMAVHRLNKILYLFMSPGKKQP